MIFIETLLEPYVFSTTAANDSCLLLFKQENLSELILIIVCKGLFQFWLFIFFSILKCSPDVVVQMNRVFDCQCFTNMAREKCLLSHSLTNWFFPAGFCWISQLKSAPVMSQIYFHLLFLKWDLQFLNFVFFGNSLKKMRLFNTQEMTRMFYALFHD